MTIRCLLIAIALSVSTAVAAPCNVREQTLVGAWEGIGKWAFFEQMSFEREGTNRHFDSWLHERPEISRGQWELQNCKLTIREPSGLTQSFTVSAIRGRLSLSSGDGKTTSSYRKIVERR